jgi:cholesterol transport system auxiliary component
LLFTVLLLLGGCAALRGNPEPYAVYAPPPAAVAKSSTAPATWQLVVDLPRASDALSGNRIAVMPTAGVIQVYPDARWRDPVPQLVQGLLVQAFEDSGRISGVAAAGAGLRADYSLALELRAFGIAYRDAGPDAVVEVSAKLLDENSRRVVAARVFDATLPAGGEGAAAAAAAIGQALDRMLPALVDWTLTEGTAASRAPAQ